jgi:hypothetical protein
MVENLDRAEAGAQTAKGDEQTPRRHKPRFFASSAAVIWHAREEMEGLTGHKVESVSGFAEVDTGWRLVVTAIELRRIPASTDVLADYEAIIDENGSIVNYHRLRRYFRAQVGEQE